MEKVSGKTALITGSTDGVGRLVARKLGQAGARVLVHGRDAEGTVNLSSRVSRIQSTGKAIRIYCQPMLQISAQT